MLWILCTPNRRIRKWDPGSASAGYPVASADYNRSSVSLRSVGSWCGISVPQRRRFVDLQIKVEKINLLFDELFSIPPTRHIQVDLNLSGQERGIIRVSSIVPDINHGLGEIARNFYVTRDLSFSRCCVRLLRWVEVDLKDIVLINNFLSPLLIH